MGKSTFFACLLLIFSSPNFGGEIQHEQKVLATLKDDEKEVLTLFFRTLLSDTLGGYVLFGEKPISIYSVSLNDSQAKFTSGIFSHHFHRENIYLRKGFEVWKSLPIKSDNYLIKLMKKPFREANELIVVNKERVKQEVVSNLNLFKYILGPRLDPQNFLDSLENTEDSFYGFMKNDRVLIGVLFGYGVQNALMQSRAEYINETLWDHKIVLPFKSGNTMASFKDQETEQGKKGTGIYQNKVTSPSFTFSTLLEEKKWLEKGHKLSLNITSRKLSFPWFGYWESKESEKLLESYLRTQEEIKRVLDSEQFLEKVFEKLFN